MKCIILLLGLLFTGFAYGQQEQVPSEGQCKLDKAVWSTDVESVSALKALAAGPLTAKELLRRSLEMSTCSIVYGNPSGDMYMAISKGYNSAYELRVSSFLQRHRDYWQQFVDEDAAGKR